MAATYGLSGARPQSGAGACGHLQEHAAGTPRKLTPRRSARSPRDTSRSTAGCSVCRLGALSPRRLGLLDQPRCNVAMFAQPEGRPLPHLVTTKW